jgi:glycosyltransferase involved in cell wall biosynthesis
MVDLNSKLKILYICSTDIAIDNGRGINEREFIKSLIRKCPQNATFLIPKPSSPEYTYGDNVVFCHTPKRKKILHHLLHNLTQLLHSVKLLRKYHYDLIILNLGIFPWALFVVTIVFKRNFVIKTLGDFYGSGRLSDGFVKKSLYKLNTKLTIRIASKVSAIDAPTKTFVNFHQKHIRGRKIKFKVIENATNLDTFYPMDRDRAKKRLGFENFKQIVGFVGGRPDFQVRALIEVSPKLTKAYPDCGIVIVGGRGIDQLKARAKELETINHFVFAGQVDYEELVDYINSFTVCVSLPPMDRVMAVGNSSQKARQYIACGKPVISPIGDNLFIEDLKLGKLVNTDDLDEIFRAISHYFDLDDQALNSFSKRAREYATDHLSTDAALLQRFNFWGRVFN